MTKQETLDAIDALIAELQAEASLPVPPFAELGTINARIGSLQAIRAAVEGATF